MKFNDSKNLRRQEEIEQETNLLLWNHDQNEKIFRFTKTLRPLHLKLKKTIDVAGYGHIGPPGVNFTNILCAAFTYVSCMRSFFCANVSGLYFAGVSLLAQKLLIEHWWNWAQVAILYILYVAFLHESFAQSFFGTQEYWCKCAYEMLVNLTTGHK